MHRPMLRRLAAALVLFLAMFAPAFVPTVHAQDKPAPSKAAVKVIPVFVLEGAVSETPVDAPLPFFDMPTMSLKDLTTCMRKAGDDPNVKAVVILSENMSLGLGQLEEVRQCMKHLRDKGKDVLVHSDSTFTGGYMLFSGASRVSFVPTADLWVWGLYGEQPYLRGLLDKLGVKPEFLTCGDYKSAAELFMRTAPSPEADRMHNWLFDSMFDTMVKLIAEGRGVDKAKAKSWIDHGLYNAEQAKAAGMIDAVEHRQDFLDHLRKTYGDDAVLDKKYGKEKPPVIDFNNPFAFIKIWADLMNAAKKPKSTKDAVAIVYVDGAIMVGSSQPSFFGAGGMAMSSDIRRALDQAANDPTIKAVVLRVDSPGGSAVASEIILDATRRVKAKKPLVVSMGNVAGSGGYYVSCAADTIFADESTITASIGVVAGKMITNDMWNKIGITFTPYQRGQNAALFSSGKNWSPEEKQRIQSWMDEVYKQFKSHVTAIRGDRLKKPIDELAGGRVFTGRQALEHGLVDKIGTMQDAIAHIAKEAKLTDYDVRVVPQPKNFFEALMDQGEGNEHDKKWIDTGDAPRLRALTPGAGDSLIDLALPHVQHLDPQRLATIRHALLQLQLMQQEGVIMMMPPTPGMR